LDEENLNNEWYSPNLPRVSNIISYIFPFKWTEWERRYLDWLRNKWINQEEYINWANEMWTKVHNSLEDYILWRKIKKDKLYKEVKDLINHWIKYLDDIKYQKAFTELYLTDWRIQGTCDLLLEVDDKLILADWKTYWVVKKRFWLDNKFLLATDKKKKVQLQMSIYAYLYNKTHDRKIDKIVLLYLHEEWIKDIELDVIPENEIENIIESYINSLEYFTF